LRRFPGARSQSDMLPARSLFTVTQTAFWSIRQKTIKVAKMLTIDLLRRLLLAAGLGAALGLEREYRQKPAGLRTNILIALGSALFTTLSTSMSDHGGTPDRIAAQVVSGIGFLGAGAILRSGTTVHGMTTAATIWVNAAIGMAAGAGEFAMATATTALTLIVLAVLQPLESYFERRAATDGERRRRKDR
jgi:putative Mg2+ transporter-C (MgtC) family protein